MNKFDLKERVDDLLCNIYNIASDLYFSMSPSLKNTTKPNEKYKNIHEGQRCFIIGTGPSLNKLHTKHINQLQSEIVFGVNSFYKAPIVKDIQPNYYTLVDNLYWDIFKNTFGEIHELYSAAPPVFVTDFRAVDLIKTLSGLPQYISLYIRNYPVSKMRYDITKNLSISMNVVSVSIQTAIFMGFKDIYLLGCDYNSFCAPCNVHCYDDKQETSKLPSHNLAYYLKHYHLITKFHYFLSSLAKDLGVNIINITEGSLLDAYPVRSVDEIL